MAIAVRHRFGCGSRPSIQRLMQDLGWRRVRQRIIAPLTPDHRAARVNHAEKWLNFSFAGDPTVVIHIDEKWFYSFRNGRTIYIPPDVPPPKFVALSKTQIPKVMFLGAVAAPRPELGRSEEHTSELQSLMRISYAVFCLKQKSIIKKTTHKTPFSYTKKRNTSRHDILN